MKNLIPLILAALICIALIGGYVFMYTSIASGIGRAEAALARSGTLTAQDTLVRSQQVFLDDTRDERTRLDAFVANDADIVSVIEIIENTAHDEGVTVAISTIDTAGGDGWAYHERVQVSFSASGTFARMTRFMSALETLPVASTLDRASLEASDGRNWFGSFSVSFVKSK